jgi:N-formylglutamate amidohydrolase
VPAEERNTICLDDIGLNAELLRMTDAYTDALFPVTIVEAARLVCPVSRLICDVERFPSDQDEPMASRGMGVLYTRTSMGEKLRRQLDPTEREALLGRWYWPHHRKLQVLVDDVARSLNRCLIVDSHSFPSVALPYELNQSKGRADICIGTDPFHTPSQVRSAVVSAVMEEGYSVAIDAPFAGALVPLAYFRKDKRISSVMIEVNRRLYMDEQSGEKKKEFEQVRDAVGRLIVSAAEALG